MIAVIFEAEPPPDRSGQYLELATQLLPALNEVEGFISVERFTSLSQPGKLLSLSFWRDEEAVRQWRESEDHRQAQKAGRDGVFTNYRLRVACIVRDYGLKARDQAPADSRDRHG
ncbi:MAG: antibiotic biosynthesis monooxygenase family protein [Devosia sp.]